MNPFITKIFVLKGQPRWMGAVVAASLVGIVSGTIVMMQVSLEAGASLMCASMGLLSTAVTVSSIQSGRVSNGGDTAIITTYRDQEPTEFWIGVGIHAVMAVGLYGASVVLLMI